ncbi:MAG: carbohydrate kinase family protein [Flaviflexus sp.]|uniref:carbohydrate kinase family protein n=1 Tax=Flaviflexus sp. TaxID=1969482 RepID=UPI00352EE44D
MGYVTQGGGRPTVYVAGSLFLDIVMAGLNHAPRPGEEQWVAGSGIMPGGVANQAVACARLGMISSVITYVGQDRAGRWVSEMLAEDNVDMSLAEHTGHQNITVSLVMEGDRALTTHGADEVPLPPEGIAAPTIFMASLPYLMRAREHVERWREQGTIVIADTGWDETGQWPVEHLHALEVADVFVPNCAEAQHYTRTLTFEDAARELTRYVPTVVVTCGGEGVHVSRRDGDNIQTEVFSAISVDAIDTTGAGDAFSAGFATGLATGASLADSIHVGQCAAAWTVSRIGGSCAAPTMHELIDWVENNGELNELVGYSVRAVQSRVNGVTTQ